MRSAATTRSGEAFWNSSNLGGSYILPLFLGPCVVGRDWEMRQERKSPNYTTCWDEVAVV